MRCYLVVCGVLLGLLLAAFLLVEALALPMLTDPVPRLQRVGATAALMGVGLLVADVIVPIPSSLVMVAHGALFGVAAGTLLSLLGSTGAAIAGFALGRRSGPLLARLVPSEERARADRLLRRWGSAALIATRPVPLLAETVAILAGASAMPWREAALASALGSLPPALLYALAGAGAAQFASSALVFALVAAVGMSTLVGRRLGRRGSAESAE